MVTAGVYLIVRCHPVFEAAPEVSDLAAGIGALTLLMAGLIALVQVDIKRVIAYSTMSQIGYMFLGAGIAAYSNAMFHLMTHAFFKALLFLAAGVVIHALANEQDIRKMGGLRKLMPRTWILFLVGGLALAGMPPLSGFFSKDAILASTLAREDAYGYLLFAAGIAGALLTGIYTFRMIFVVFGGEPSAFVREHLHLYKGKKEGPPTMMWPVYVLGVLAVVGGWVQIAGVRHPFSSFLDGTLSVGEREHLSLLEPSVTQDYVTSAIAVAAGLIGIWVAWTMYWTRTRPVLRQPALQSLFEHKFWWDELYDAIFYRPAAAFSVALTRWIEGPLIGGSLTGVAGGTRELARGVTRLQTGFLRTYALAIAGGVAVLALVFVSLR
jgi:NADH-quinone oxidoreductase subunit L